jgi:hypothetical protein
VHWYKTEFGSQHSDWLQMREDGTPLSGVYQTGTDFCVNSPWREWVFQVLRDLCGYSIDGIFFDGPIFFPDTCYCRWCQEKFKNAYSSSLPSKKERKGKPFRTLLEFQAESLRDFLRDSRQVIKSINPNRVLQMAAFAVATGQPPGSTACWLRSRHSRQRSGFIYDLPRTHLEARRTAKLLETQAPTNLVSSSQLRPTNPGLFPSPAPEPVCSMPTALANVWL